MLSEREIVQWAEGNGNRRLIEAVAGMEYATGYYNIIDSRLSDSELLEDLGFSGYVDPVTPLMDYSAIVRKASEKFGVDESDVRNVFSGSALPMHIRDAVSDLAEGAKRVLGFTIKVNRDGYLVPEVGLPDVIKLSPNADRALSEYLVNGTNGKFVEDVAALLGFLGVEVESLEDPAFIGRFLPKNVNSYKNVSWIQSPEEFINIPGVATVSSDPIGDLEMWAEEVEILLSSDDYWVDTFLANEFRA